MGDAGTPYDASHYHGVRFWGLDRGFERAKRVRFTPTICRPTGEAASARSTPLATTARSERPLTTEWTHQKILFRGSSAEYERLGAISLDIDIHHVYSLTFNFLGSDPFDLWITILFIKVTIAPGRARRRPDQRVALLPR